MADETWDVEHAFCLARGEFEARRAYEQAKARRKYGAAGLAPGGDPARDVFDYAANELVGLVRYVDMIESRLAQYAPNRRAQIGEVCRQMRADARKHGTTVLTLRRILLDAGIQLGAPEPAGG